MVVASLFRLGAARAARSSACGSRHFGGAVSLSSSSSACSFRIVAAARGAAFAPLRTCAGVRSFAAATTFDLKPLVVPEKTAEEFRATETPSNDEVSKGGYPILHAVVRRGAGSNSCDTGTCEARASCPPCSKAGKSSRMSCSWSTPFTS